MLGGQSCFSVIPNINWYKGQLKRRIIRLLLINLCMIPSWVLCYYQNQIMTNRNVRNIGLKNLYLDLFHFLILYYFLFAIAPIIFHRLKLCHVDVKYSMLTKK